MYRYNVPHGKLNRGMAVLEGVRAIRKEQLRAKHGEDATLPASEERLAIVVGWCIELVRSLSYSWRSQNFKGVSRVSDREYSPCWRAVASVLPG